jgi:hypothetical protein
MLDGFQYVLVQIGFVVAVTALLAGVLGWLIGRSNGRRRAEKPAAQSASARPVVAEEPAPNTAVAEVAPTHASPEPATEPAPDTAVAEVVPTHASPEPATEPLIDHVPLHAIEDPDRNEDPDRTVIAMPPWSGGSGTTRYLPPTAVDTYFAPVASPAPTVGASGVRVVTVEEVQFLRQELRKRDLEIGRIEAGALSAWDRMVPQLEQQIEDLTAEGDSLRRRLREAEEHSDAGALSTDHLRALVADRDTKIAELRAQS